MDRSRPRLTVLRLGLFLGLALATALAAHARRQVAAPPLPVGGTPPSQAARIEAVFVLDTTGSMSGLLEGAKRRIWELANQMASGQPRPEIRIGLVGYRDRGDAYVTRRHDLTGDLDAVDAALSAFQAGGGGDTPESVNQALHEAVTQLSWSRDAGVYRVLFLVGDAPPHGGYANDVPWHQTLELARKRDIVVNTVQCGSLASTTPVWRAIAQEGGGRYAAIAQDGAMLALATPMDDELSRLNAELAATALAWGDRDAKAELADTLRRTLAAPAEAVASRLSYLQKLGRISSGRADLVEAVERGLVSLDEVEEEALPEAMRELAPPEREALLERTRQERQVLQERVAELSREREAWLREARLRRAPEAPAFDDEVLDAVREQARSRGILYE